MISRTGVWRALVLLVGVFLAATGWGQDYVRDSEPQLFTYDELLHLGVDQKLSPELTEKLHQLTTTPFINNESFYRGAKPRAIEVEHLGPSLRVAFWNIERGLELDDIRPFLTDKYHFMVKVADCRHRVLISAATPSAAHRRGICYRSGTISAWRL